MLGPPGSGKGTQARLLVEYFGLSYFESGKLVREIAKNDPEINEIVNTKGELIPEEKMTKYVQNYLIKNLPETKNILFDGYPRSTKQYTFLKKYLSSKNTNIYKAILLNVSEEVIFSRLSARRRDKETGKIYNLVTNPPPENIPESRLTQRKDDKSKAIKERLHEYRKDTVPMVKSMADDGILAEVDGERSIEHIFEETKSIIRGKND